MLARTMRKGDTVRIEVGQEVIEIDFVEIFNGKALIGLKGDKEAVKFYFNRSHEQRIFDYKHQKLLEKQK